MFRAFLLALIASVILVISPPHASADGDKCASGAQAIKSFQPTLKPKNTSSAPFFEDGKIEQTLSDYLGSGLVVNFWATWCAPCVREMPALDRLQAMVKDDGIRVLVISEDRGGAPVVDKFFAKNKIANLQTLLDRRGKLMRKSGVSGLPATLLIDAQGKEIGRVMGTAEWDSEKAVAFIRRCLGGT